MTFFAAILCAEVFHLFDVDNDGKIPISDIGVPVRALCSVITQHDLQTMLNKCCPGCTFLMLLLCYYYYYYVIITRKLINVLYIHSCIYVYVCIHLYISMYVNAM